MMLPAYTARLLREVHPRILARFLVGGLASARAIRRFEEHRRQGDVFPPFLFLSITNRCNLSCRGCWVSPTDPPAELDLATLDRIVGEARQAGNRFFGLLGGEPLLHAGLFELIGRHPDCCFQVFTNGTLLTEAVAREMRRLGNVTPLVSLEGREAESDRRRGGTDVYARSVAGIERCRRHRLLTGVASSLCRSNLDDLASRAFVADMIRLGAHYLWYYIYRPVGADPAPELALTRDDILRVRRFLVDARPVSPILLVDAYWDDRGRALCPAAVGISHHITPSGYVEPCPPIQFARDAVSTGAAVRPLIASSAFLRRFRETAAAATRGCILLERPDLLSRFLEAEGAIATSGRAAGLAELGAMRPQAGHHQPGDEIPERHWLYRFAKKRWFFGFGAYG